jgi:hypothetical protein
VRLRFGSATLTEKGPIPDPFQDDTERQGAWAGTLTVAIQAMDALSDTTQHALMALPVEHATTWWLLDLCSRQLRRVASPDPYWIEFDAPTPELLAEVLVRLSGPAEAITSIVSGLRREAMTQRERDAASGP